MSNELDPVIHVDPSHVSTEGEPDAGDTTAEPAIPAALREVDPEKLKQLREKIKKFATNTQKTISGSEAPVEGTPSSEGTGQVTTGKDVDWSEYELEYSVRHLYKDATFRMTEQGPKWVAQIDEFHSTERDFRNYDGKTTKGEFLNLGRYLNDMLNSPEGWRLVSILPTSGGRAGVMLQRAVSIVLPDPVPLKKETEVKAPTDPEIQRTEDASLEFMEKEGLTVAPAPVDDGLGGAQPNSAEAQALSINPPTERDPLNLRLLGGVDSVPPIDEAAGKAAEAALAGEDFGEVLSTMLTEGPKGE